jgi:hypothetical protein
METPLQPKLFDNDTDTEETTKLINGWYGTMKYGDVFVNHGKAWAVQIVKDRMVNVVVELTHDDIIGRSAIEKMKDIVKSRSRKALRQTGK